MELTCSSLRFSPASTASRYCKLLPSCKAANLAIAIPNNFSSPAFHFAYNNSSKPVFHRKHSRNFIRACSQISTAGSGPVLDKFAQFKDAFWRFLRPHTIRGTALGSTSLVARALIENPNLIRWSLVLKAFSGLVALICGNGYIVGINQIYDIGIDKVNKPYLPIAAGDLSVQSAWLLVLFFAVAGLLTVGMNFGPFITSLYTLGLFLGTIYSVPPFRMKRFAVVAFLIIATVRGFLLNYGVYYATRAALGLGFEWSSPVAFITTFVTLFALVIAITKDLPDVEGDRKFQISTLATKLGVRNIAFLGSGLLLTNYVGAIAAAIYMPQAFRSSLMISVHVILALCLVFQFLNVECKRNIQVFKIPKCFGLLDSSPKCNILSSCRCSITHKIFETVSNDTINNLLLLEKKSSGIMMTCVKKTLFSVMILVAVFHDGF